MASSRFGSSEFNLKAMTKRVSQRWSNHTGHTSRMSDSDGDNPFGHSPDHEAATPEEQIKDFVNHKGKRFTYSWEELNRIEKERLKILGKVEFPFWRVLLSINGTCLHPIVTDPMIWTPIGIFLLIRILAYTNKSVVTMMIELGVDGAGGQIGILGGFLSFFLVLFVNQTNQRFFDMYALSRACSGRVQDIAGYAAARLPPAEAHRLVRYMNAAHLAGYVGLKGPYTKEHFFDHFNNLHGFLQKEEFAKFTARGIDMNDMRENDVFKEMCTWCQKEVAMNLKNGLLNPFEANEMQTRILMLRAHMDGIHDTCFQPPHFFYIHFLCLLSGLYLPLFAIDSAVALGWENFHWSAEIVAATILILQSIFVVGLRLLGQKMIDPYGDDYEDLAVITIVSGCIEITRIILDSHNQDPVDEKLEDTLHLMHNEHTKEEKF